jgi:negative regulator of sigma E activity
LNCRRVNGLLSAYIDSEVTGEEMLAIRDHLEQCAGCAAEHEALLQTKRLLSSLALRAPRADMEALLQDAIEREESRPHRRWLESLLVRPLRNAWEAVAYADIPARPSTVMATMALSVVGLWVASGVAEQWQHEQRHRREGELILLSGRVATGARPVAMNDVPSSGVSFDAPSGFGADTAVTSASYINADASDPSLIGSSPYAAPTHLEGGFGTDLSFAFSVGGAVNRVSASRASTARRVENALLMR